MFQYNLMATYYMIQSKLIELKCAVLLEYAALLTHMRAHTPSFRLIPTDVRQDPVALLCHWLRLGCIPGLVDNISPQTFFCHRFASTHRMMYNMYISRWHLLSNHTNSTMNFTISGELLNSAHTVGEWGMNLLSSYNIVYRDERHTI